MSTPRPNTTSRSLRALPLASPTALWAHHLKKPAWSVIVLMTINPRKNSRMLSVALSTSKASRGDTTPVARMAIAPRAAAVPSLSGLGRAMMRTRVMAKMTMARIMRSQCSKENGRAILTEVSPSAFPLASLKRRLFLLLSGLGRLCHGLLGRGGALLACSGLARRHLDTSFLLESLPFRQVTPKFPSSGCGVQLRGSMPSARDGKLHLVGNASNVNRTGVAPVPAGVYKLSRCAPPAVRQLCSVNHVYIIERRRCQDVLSHVVYWSLRSALGSGLPTP